MIVNDMDLDAVNVADDKLAHPEATPEVSPTLGNSVPSDRRHGTDAVWNVGSSRMYRDYDGTWTFTDWLDDSQMGY
ncbi:hypothetical protein P0W64_15330 [Tsukamurella sp. 8F]|uniref:hypothetical protein n=1 Tax=unclassified Tsukamurella TaxID=2633480 RepID=UPI0023B9618D|nr:MULTISPECIES: hypothetical protein [unclassified Tsukamurella]MDF0530905.1 hypothetical protein [Tsukamurella sp. 8J]MDF0588150.1 hypothetical protein [Tsukamurella sp. 8F]